jgi:hypothetical protein
MEADRPRPRAETMHSSAPMRWDPIPVQALTGYDAAVVTLPASEGSLPMNLACA